MIETRYYKIDNRIFSLTDIRKIAVLIEQEYKKSDKKKGLASLRFSVRCEDDSKFETESADLFDENTINTKKVKDIEFYFVDYKEDKSIQLSLKNGNYFYGNELKISGADSNWVNGCLIKLREIIEGSEPQINFVNKFGLPLTILFSLSLGIIFLYVLATVGRTIAGKPAINPFKLFFEEPQLFFTGALVVGGFPAMYIIEWLKNIFPNVEIQIGPNHSFVEKNRRKMLFGVITLILVPIVLALLFK